MDKELLDEAPTFSGGIANKLILDFLFRCECARVAEHLNGKYEHNIVVGGNDKNDITITTEEYDKNDTIQTVKITYNPVSKNELSMGLGIQYNGDEREVLLSLTVAMEILAQRYYPGFNLEYFRMRIFETILNASGVFNYNNGIQTCGQVES